jgi:hypothetical protein
LPSVSAWIEANRSRFRPGVLTEVVIEHDESCPYPTGGRCRCKYGPEIRIKDDRPEEN